VTIPWLWKRRRIRFLLLTGVLFSFGLAVEVWKAPHYAAPAMGLTVLLVVEALRQLRADRGAFWSAPRSWPAFFRPSLAAMAALSDGRDRARILKQLESTGERHLVLVRYR